MEENWQRPGSQPRVWMSAAIAAGFVLLVILPLAFAVVPSELANWYLAAAANELQIGDGDYEDYLASAEQWHPDLKNSYNFWLLRTQIALRGNAGEIVQVINEAKGQGVNYRRLAGFAFNRLQAEGEHEAAVAVREASLPEEIRSHPQILNELAYLRSLAGVELDKALAEIDQALQEIPDSPSWRGTRAAFRDTRAWILFQMGRPLDALEDANEAVRLTEQEFAAAANGGLLSQWLPAPKAEPKANALARAGKALTEQEAGRDLWNYGVLRYHRAKILDALGRASEAEEDFDWLREHGLPLNGELE